MYTHTTEAQIHRGGEGRAALNEPLLVVGEPCPIFCPSYVLPVLPVPVFLYCTDDDVAGALSGDAMR